MKLFLVKYVEEICVNKVFNIFHPQFLHDLSGSYVIGKGVRNDMGQI